MLFIGSDNRIPAVKATIAQIKFPKVNPAFITSSINFHPFSFSTLSTFLLCSLSPASDNLYPSGVSDILYSSFPIYLIAQYWFISISFIYS